MLEPIVCCGLVHAKNSSNRRLALVEYVRPTMVRPQSRHTLRVVLVLLRHNYCTSICWLDEPFAHEIVFSGRDCDVPNNGSCRNGSSQRHNSESDLAVALRLVLDLLQ